MIETRSNLQPKIIPEGIIIQTRDVGRTGDGNSVLLRSDCLDDLRRIINQAQGIPEPSSDWLAVEDGASVQHHVVCVDRFEHLTPLIVFDRKHDGNHVGRFEYVLAKWSEWVKSSNAKQVKEPIGGQHDTCDWGGCDKPANEIRDGLPVCDEHAEK